MPQSCESVNVDQSVEMYFSIDHNGAREYCSQAKASILAGDTVNAEKMLLKALRLQPSAMLAYSLLSQLHRESGNADLALQCQRGVLPQTLLSHLVQDLPQLEPLHYKNKGAEQSLLERILVHSEEQLDMPQAVELGAANTSITFANEKFIRSGPCFIDRIEQGVIWHDTRHTLVWDNRFVEVVEHTLADSAMVSVIAAHHRPFHLEGRVFLIGARGAHNFYHWMTDIAPKLGLLKSAGFNFELTDQFVVPHADNTFSRQLLQAFGISDKQIYATENEFPYVSADELVVPFLHNKMGLTMGRWLPEVMRSVFEITTTSAETACRRLYIQRADSASDGRQIVNETELLDLLQQSGFETVQTEHLTVAEQARLFSTASVVVAAHGAALSNLLFCQPGTKVIELYANHLAPCYRAISALCDLQYFRLFCGSDEELKTEAAKRSGNLSVPLAALRKVL